MYIRDPDTLLQLLIKNKAYYLQIKAGLLRSLERFLQTIPALRIKLFQILEVPNLDDHIRRCA